MKTQRFVLTYTGEGPMPSGDVKQLKEQVSVLDQRSQSLLVEDAPEHLSRMLQTMPRWQAGPERMRGTLNLGSRFPLGLHHRWWILVLIGLSLLIYFTLY